MIDAGKVAEILTDRFGVPMVGKASDDANGQWVHFFPRDIPHTQGFQINVLIGWKTVEADFTPASYAKPLLSEMAAADAEKRSLFQAFVQASMQAGADVVLRINDEKVDPLTADCWPSVWNSLSLRLVKSPIEIDGKNPDAMQELALSWSIRIFGCVLSMMPLEPVSHEPAGEGEGGGRQALITRFERSEINRVACIEIHGTRCKVCDFDFEKVYGTIGAGFIEVHHVELLARLAPDTVLNPAIDLVPLCANCHSMAHKRRPQPYSVEDLKAMIQTNRRQ